jgi:hypothetical protein
MLDEACAALEVAPKQLSPFDVADPFNGHRLQGYLCHASDHRYGALYLTHVDGAAEPQVIYATPKLHYPFDRTGAYRFPPARRVEVYEKLDGTNVLAYRYRHQGQKFRTYKLRLSPVVRNSRFGPFLDFWQELLARYPDIPTLPDLNDCNVSFEVYGARNKHLIVYDTPLDTAVLFGVDAEGRVRPPSVLETRGVPVAPLHARLESRADLVREYQSHQAECEAANRELEDGAIAGSEGRVWYLHGVEGQVILLKCKPESVEQIHWAQGGLSKNVVLATAYNVLETADELTYDGVKTLLLEEFSEEAIERFREHILEVVAQIRAEVAFREEVLAFYRGLGRDLATHKREVMRAFAQQYPKNVMRKIYSLLESSA